MKNKLLLVLLFVCVSSMTLLVGKGVTQSFQNLYAKTIQFENNGAGITLTVGLAAKNGANTVTIPDVTGTVATSASTAITATTIACWKSAGQLGKCTTSISGVTCSTCT